MDLTVLRKKINTFRGEAGRLRNVDDEVLYEILMAWENWTGTSKDFYSALGITHKKIAKILGKARRMKREGYFSGGDFKEITVEEDNVVQLPIQNQVSGIELVWNDKIIKFSNVDILLEFLQKAA